MATADLTAMNTNFRGGGRFLGSAGVLYQKVNVDLSNEIGIFDDGDLVIGGSFSWDLADDSLTRPFVSFEFLGTDRTSVGVEYRWKDSTLDDKAVFSAVLRHEFTGGFTGELGTDQRRSVRTRAGRRELVRTRRLQLRFASSRSGLQLSQVRDGAAVPRSRLSQPVSYPITAPA